MPLTASVAIAPRQMEKAKVRAFARTATGPSCRARMGRHDQPQARRIFPAHHEHEANLMFPISRLIHPPSAALTPGGR